MESRKFSFQRSISIDGVAVIIACISCSVWFGTLSQTVKDHTESLKHLTRIQETQGETLRVMNQSIAVLTTIVEERKSNGTHK